jgi:DNA-binding response OmpR family regulator
MITKGETKERHRILVVDDEENIRLLYKGELEDEGYDVIVAGSGEEALALFEKFPPDLVTLDIKMPGMGGLKTLEQIREKSLEIPVILCTAYGEFRRDFNSWASDAYLVKSSNLTELKNKIKCLLA